MSADYETEYAVNWLRLERLRQIHEEGYDREHDDGHDWRQFVKAATAYLLAAVDMPHHGAEFWPWEPEYFKPKSPFRNMVRAGALLIAGMERFARERIEPLNPTR